MLPSRLMVGASILFALGASAACGGVTEFSGAQAFAIHGTPPPAPPPKQPEPEPQPRVELRDNKIELKEKIQFDVNKATIKPVSHSLLHEIAEVMRANPQLKRISIEGHASVDGEPWSNQKLSDGRAKAVRRYLVKKEGIPAAALSARGWGADKPIADNGTLEGREANRRVEFLVIEQDVTVVKVEINPTTGTERVVDEKQDTIKADTGAVADSAAAKTIPAPRRAKAAKTKTTDAK